MSGPALRLRYHGLSDIGRRRKQNEDAYLALQGSSRRQGLFAVADGIGGHRAGDVASKMACEGLEAFFREWCTEPGERAAAEILRRSLVEALFRIDEQIVQLASTDETYADMGTTLSCVLVAESRAIVAHVGDSRIYRLRENSLDRLTTDHTFVQDLVSYGELTPAQAAVHPFKHMLTAAVGTGEPLEEVFYDTLEIEPEDRFLLCTDGLHDMLNEDRIMEMLGRSSPPRDVVSALVAAANDAGGKDNVTAVVIHAQVREP